MNITLPILHHNDETSSLKDLGLEYSLADCAVKPVTFFQIAAICPYEEGGKEFTSIFSNGEEFICELSYATVWDKVKRHIDESSARK